jgi:membrane fusion protein, multidrug efflux system
MNPRRALLLLACVACSKAEPPPPPAPPPAETVAIASRTLNTIDHLPAQLIAYEAVDVYPKVTGFIDDLRVDVGSHVKKGDLLVRLSAPELAAQLAQASASVQTAESHLTTTRAKLIADQGTYDHLEAAAKTPGVVAGNDLDIAKQTVEADKGNVGAAEHGVSAARDTLRAAAQTSSYLDVRAPFDGTVTHRNLHPGALVGPSSGSSGSQPIVSLVDTDRLRLVVPVPEAEVAAMTLGQVVSFTVPAYLDKTFEAPIARISHDIDVHTRTMNIELDVTNTDGKLSPGSFATVSWAVARSYPTLFVPTSAVTSDQQKTFVIRVVDGKAKWTTVKTGHSDKGDIEVVGDLRAGDQVVRNATDSIRDGDAVEAAPKK